MNNTLSDAVGAIAPDSPQVRWRDHAHANIFAPQGGTEED